MDKLQNELINFTEEEVELQSIGSDKKKFDKIKKFVETRKGKKQVYKLLKK